MRRQRVIWLLCVPLTAVSGFATHVAVQRLPAHPHTSAHGSFRHIDLSHLPLCVAVCTAVAMGALGLAAVRGWLARPPLWLFALVPPVGFVAQEQVVALAGEGTPTFGLALLTGLVLQIPFALAAYAMAAAVLGFAARVVRLLRARSAVVLRAPAVLVEPGTAAWPRPPAFVLGYGPRAPPAFS